MVVSGRFAVTKHGPRGVIAEIGPDQPIGEIAFLTGGARTATVAAMRDSLVLRLSRDEFEELARANPSIWRALTATLARRLAETTAAAAIPPDPRPRTLAVIPARRSPLPPQLLPNLSPLFYS